MTVFLSELPPQKQFAVMKLFMEGEIPLFKGEEVILPDMISARYVCADCGKFVIPTFYLDDIVSIAKRVKCPHCSGNMSLYLMGTELQQEVKRIRKGIQRKIYDFF